MSNKELVSKIEIIKKIFQGKQFKNYIEYITFPYYRNLKEFTQITFDFPLTVFVGKNGSGKSSTLHALYGAPKGYSVGGFWFSTSVDPIKEVGTDGLRHCFYYGYREGNDIKEVLVHRASRPEDPDCWETSKPAKKHNMRSTERSAPISKKVIYMDFRGELSAFDKYFYFDEPSKNLASKTKQDYLRKQSQKLKKIIENKQLYNILGRKQNDPPRELNDKELFYISYILGKKYIGGKIIEHKLFNKWGTSVVLQNEFCKYTEAYAGSGEIAVVKLVSSLLEAEDYSLVLLDEPEVSLHPGAQKRLLSFLLDQMKEKKHQVIVSTHSPSFVECLPANAIKVFSSVPDSGKFEVLNSCYPMEAFWHLEEPITNKIMLLVEDKLACEIIKKVLESLGSDKEALFQVEYFPGGESVIKQDFISVYSREEEKRKFIVFDGDQKPKGEITKIDDISIRDAVIPEKYEEIIKQLTGTEIKFNVDGNDKNGGRDDQKIDLMRKYIKYFSENVYFLPGNIPEEIIWDAECVGALLKIFDAKNGSIESLKKIENAKARMFMAAEIIYGDGRKIEELENLLLTKFIKAKNALYGEIVNIIDGMLNKASKIDS